MSRTLACGIALLGTAAVPLPASAATAENFALRSAADLVAVCSVAPTDEATSAAAGFCHGFVVGVYRTLEQVQAARPAARIFCPSASQPSRTEAISAYVAWAGARSDQQSKTPQDSIAEYLAATHPCPAEERPAPTANRRRMP